MVRVHAFTKFITPLNVLLTGVLLIAITFSVIKFAYAVTPNPGHAFSEIDLNQVTKTTSATLLVSETVVLADATSGAITLTLPPASNVTPRTVYFIKKIDTALTNLITIDPNGSETIDSLLTIQLAQRGESIVLQTDGTNWRSLARRDFDLSGYKTRGATLNQWYTSPNTGTALGTGAPTVNRLRAIPFVVSKITTIDAMAINVTTIGTASNARIGIYADNGNNYPGTLVADAGAAITTTVGVKTYTTNLPVTLDTGLYWLVHTSDGSAAATLRAFVLASLNPVLGYAATLPTNAQFGWDAAFTYAALPATYPAGAAAITAIPVPAIFVRTSL